MELSLLIAKQEVRRPGVEFQPVDLVRMRDCDLLGAFGTLAGDDEVGDSRGVRIHQVRNLFAILPAATLRLANANREQMRRDVTRSKRPNHLIHAVFDHRELPGVVYHAHAFSVEIERLEPEPLHAPHSVGTSPYPREGASQECAPPRTDLF